MKVLVTGAAGVIGRVFRERYADYYSLKSLYYKTFFKPMRGEEVVQGDVTDFDSVLRAIDGVDAVVHLAHLWSREGWGEWETAQHNMSGTYNVFETARVSGLKKVVFASSNYACGYTIKEESLVSPGVPYRPYGFYGVNKVFGEILGRYYSDKYGISVVCLRIGWCLGIENPSNNFKETLSQESSSFYATSWKKVAMWISNRDLAQLIHRSLETKLKYGVFYGASENTPKIFDLTNTKEKLGYKPKDHAEDFLS
jgi:nucleoside-diphosphate-sugar epimerase